MKNKDFLTISMVIFLVVGLVHAYRAFNNLPVMFNHTVIPVSVSWVGAAVALYLAYSAHKLRS